MIATGSRPAASAISLRAEPPALDVRTRLLLDGPIAATLLRLAWPNILVMLAQACTVSLKPGGYRISARKRWPVVMLVQMISAGAMGGGISSAVARALGAGRRDQADALVLHAIVINIALGILFSAVMLLFGPQVYRALGGSGGELDTALRYSNVVFAGNVLLC